MPGGLPGQPDSWNAIFSPGKFNNYEGGAFPGISDLLHEIDDLDDIPKAAHWKEIWRHMSDLMIMILEATWFLNPVEQIWKKWVLKLNCSMFKNSIMIAILDTSVMRVGNDTFSDPIFQN